MTYGYPAEFTEMHYLKHDVMCTFQFRKSCLIYGDLGLLVIFCLEIAGIKTVIIMNKKLSYRRETARELCMSN